jgi:hypothetical protein
MSESTSTKTGSKIVSIVIGILVFGSIWGFFEATLGGFLNMIIFPNKGAIMGGIGMAIMSAFLAIYKKPLALPFIGVIAASFKLLNIWLVFVPISLVNVINPAMAIILEATVFGLIAVLVLKMMKRNPVASIGVGVLVGLIAATAYVYFAVYVTHSPIFKRLGISSVQQFIAGSGVIQAVFFGIFVPAGYALGNKLANIKIAALSRPSLKYAVSAAVIVACWGISALTVITGF